MNAAKNLADIVRETAYKVHVYLGVGFLEKVCENALVNRLRKSGHRVEQQVTVKAYDEDGTLLVIMWLICLLTVVCSLS